MSEFTEGMAEVTKLVPHERIPEHTVQETIDIPVGGTRDGGAHARANSGAQTWKKTTAPPGNHG